MAVASKEMKAAIAQVKALDGRCEICNGSRAYITHGKINTRIQSCSHNVDQVIAIVSGLDISVKFFQGGKPELGGYSGAVILVRKSTQAVR